MRRLTLLAAAALLSACQPAADNAATNEPALEPITNEAAVNAPVTLPATNEPAPATNTTVPAKPAPTGDFHSALRLTGTEPFWGVQIGDKITLQRPDHADITVANAGPTINGDVAVWNSPQLTVRLEKGECSDGMSDNRYPYKATVRVGGETLKGCAARADQWPRGGG